MAPSKRSASITFKEEEEEDYLQKQKQEEQVHIPSTATNLPAKRLRGGGDLDDAPPEEFFPDDDDDLDRMEPPEEMDEFVEPLVSSVFSDITESMRQRWLRPPVQCKTNKEDLSLQWLDMDTIDGAPLTKNPNESSKHIVGSTTGQVPVIRVYGVSEKGNSVAAFIHGFTPYAYFALPPNSTFQNVEDNLSNIRQHINNRMEGAARGSRLPEYCRAVSYVTSHKSIMGYDTQHTHFFKVTVATPTLIPTLKRIMEEGIVLAGVETSEEPIYQPFECNVPFVLRYMVDREIAGAGWLTLPKTTYQIRDESKKQTHCQVRLLIGNWKCGRSFSISRAGSFSGSSHTLYFLCSFTLFDTVNRWKSILRTRTSSPANQRASGARWHHCGFYPLISSVRVVKDTSPRQKKIPSFKLVMS
jgi:hypothetical protein